METFKIKSFNPHITEEELKRCANTTSFISFERAIRESEEVNNMNRNLKGYIVTEQGIILILED